MLCSWQRVFTICLFFSLREMFAKEIDHSLDCRICNGYQICGRRQSQMPSCINGFPCTEEQYYLCGKIDETMRSQECDRPGKFSDPDSQNKFYTCVIDDNTLDFKKQTFTCPTHTTYDLLTRHCLTTNERNLLSIVQIDERERTEEQKFFCKDFGIFADPYDCKIYHSCNAKLESQDFYCSFGKYFDGSDCTGTKSKWCMQQLMRQNEKQTRQAEKIYVRIKQFQKTAPPSSDYIPTLKDDETNKQRETVTPLVNYENNEKRTTEVNDVTATTVGNEYEGEGATTLPVDEVTVKTVGNEYDEEDATSPQEIYVTATTVENGYIEDGTTAVPVSDVTTTTDIHDYNGNGTTRLPVNDVTALTLDDEYNKDEATETYASEASKRIFHDIHGDEDDEYNKEEATETYASETSKRIFHDIHGDEDDEYNKEEATETYASEASKRIFHDIHGDEDDEEQTIVSQVSDVTAAIIDETTGSPLTDVTTTRIRDDYMELGTTALPVTDVRSTTSVHDYNDDGTTELAVSSLTTTPLIDDYNKNGRRRIPMTNVTTTSIHDDFMEVGMTVLPVTDVRTTTRISPTVSTNFVKIHTPFYGVQGNGSQTEKTTHSPKFTTASTEISAPERNKTLHHNTSTTPHTTTKKMWRATSRRTQKTLRFRCPHAGYFRDPNDCHSFYRCKTVWKPCSSCKKRKRSFRVTRHTCKHGKWLSKFFWICVHSKPLGC